MENLKEKNTCISKLKQEDVLELFEFIKGYEIPYQKRLSNNEDISFGMEIEFEHILNIHQTADDFYDERDKKNWIGFTITDDGSLFNGLEIQSPICRNNYYIWEDLKGVCAFARKKGKIGANSSSHVHIGANYLGEDVNAWLNLFYLYRTYEHIIYRFSYGEYLNHRPFIMDHAKPIAEKVNNLIFESDKSSFDDLYRSFYRIKSKYLGMSLVHTDDCFERTYRNTVEFRSANGSLNPIIWQNNVNAFLNLVATAKTKELDYDKLNYTYYTKYDEYILKNYNKLYIEDALTFADLIFDNDLDKINFLKQYFKNFKEKSGYKKYKLTK